jgi:hypothetical protein
VARDIGRKAWQWPCSVDSPFNLPLSTFATYGQTGLVTGAWASQLPIYVASSSDPQGTLYIRDGAGSRQSDFLNSTTSRSALPSATQAALIASSHQTPDLYDQMHAGFTTHLLGNPFINYRPMRLGWSTAITLPSNAVPLDQVDGNPDGVITIVQPDGTVLEAAGAVRTDAGLVAASGSVWDPKSDCTFAQNGVRASMIPAMVGVIRAGELTNGVIPHALTGAATDALLGAAAVQPAGGFSPNSTGNKALYFGSLLAIPANINLYQLHLSPQGLIIAKALQDYGFYVVDRGNQGGNNGTPAITLQYEAGTSDANAWFSGPSASSDLTTIAALLAVVSNNNAQVGTTGRAPIAPLTWFNNSGTTSAPNPPSGVHADTNPLHNSVTVFWSPAASQVPLAAYYIYRNGLLVGSVPSDRWAFEDMSYVDHFIIPGQTYSYTVAAVDQNHGLSSPSAAASFLVPYYAVAIYNGDFHDGLGGWKLTYGAPDSAPITQPGAGPAGANAALLPPHSSIQQPIAVQPSQQYQVNGQFNGSDNSQFQVCNSLATCPYSAVIPTSANTQTPFVNVQGIFDTGADSTLTVKVINSGSIPAQASNLSLIPAVVTPTLTPSYTPTSTVTFTPSTTTTATNTFTASATLTSITETDTPTGTATATNTATTVIPATTTNTPTGVVGTNTRTPTGPTTVPTFVPPTAHWFRLLQGHPASRPP